MHEHEREASPEWLRAQARFWIAEGLIRADQARLILARYGLEGEETPRSLKRAWFIQMITVLGALLAGVGVLMMVGANWEAMSRMSRLFLLLAATAASYAGGWYLWKERGNHPAVGQALVLMGSLFWGAGIFLVGQMYQSTGSSGGERMALLYWFVGTLPLGMLLLSQVQTALSIVLGLIWWLWTWFDVFGQTRTVQPVLLTAFVLGLLIFAKGRLVFGWPSLAALGPVCQTFGIAIATVAAYLLSFHDIGWEPVAASYWLHPLFYLPAGAAAIFGAYSGWRDRAHRGASLSSVCVAGLAVLAVGLALATCSAPAVRPAGMTGYFLGVPIVFNVLLLALEAGFVWLGWETGSPGLVNWGVGVFFVHLLTRYFDVFAEMLPTGMAFVGAGALLLLGGMALERQRKRLLRSMEART